MTITTSTASSISAGGGTVRARRPLPARHPAHRVQPVAQLQHGGKVLFHRHGETVGGDDHRLLVFVAAGPRRAARGEARRSRLKNSIGTNGRSGAAISSSAIIGWETTVCAVTSGSGIAGPAAAAATARQPRPRCSTAPARPRWWSSVPGRSRRFPLLGCAARRKVTP